MEFPWVSRNGAWSPGLTAMLQNLTEFMEFDWSLIFCIKNMLLMWIREAFGVNPRESDDSDLKLAPYGTRMTITRDYVCI